MIVEIESIHGNKQRLIYYRGQDEKGNWHSYGPIITTDANFDAEAHKAVVAVKLAAQLEVT